MLYCIIWYNIYIYIYIHMYMHMYIYTYMYTYVNTIMCVYIYIYIYIYICVQIDAATTHRHTTCRTRPTPCQHIPHKTSSCTWPTMDVARATAQHWITTLGHTTYNWHSMLIAGHDIPIRLMSRWQQQLGFTPLHDNAATVWRERLQNAWTSKHVLTISYVSICM